MDYLEEGLKCLYAADESAARFLSPASGAAPDICGIKKKLLLYMDEIERFNSAYGLVKVKNREELVTRHILDSLAPLGQIARFAQAVRPAPAGAYRIADAGSGAGLPGIPLAICLPRVEFSLIERMSRRAGFLRNAAAVLALKNISVEETDTEQAEGGRFNLVVFRALSPLEPALVKGLSRLLAPASQAAQVLWTGGLIAAYKGRRETAARELEAATAAPEGSGKNFEGRLEPLHVPFLNEERCLALIRPVPEVKENR